MNLPNRPETENFSQVLQLIQQAKSRALSTVNQQLLELYWQIGEYLSNQVTEQGWGDCLGNTWTLLSEYSFFNKIIKYLIII